MQLSDHQLDLLRHMLGINTPEAAAPRPYRNYAAVDPEDAEYHELALVGAVERYRRAGPGNSFDYYRCTPAGQAAALASHRRIRYPKARRVYLRFLDVNDALPDLTFRDFLMNPRFAVTRREA